MSGITFNKIIPITLIALVFTSVIYILYSKYIQENTAKEILAAFSKNDLNKLEDLACQSDSTNDRSSKVKATILYETLKRSNSEIISTSKYNFPYTNTTFKDSNGREIAFVVTSYKIFANRACFIQGVN